MSRPRAATLAPEVQSSLRRQLLNQNYQRILVNLGQDYLPVLDTFHGLSGATWASGPIGIRARQLKIWLSETVD